MVNGYHGNSWMKRGNLWADQDFDIQTTDLL
jgi:hypothetical protein